MMRIYLRNNPAKFHPDPIWNDGTFFEARRSNQNKKQQQHRAGKWLRKTYVFVGFSKNLKNLKQTSKI